MPGSSSGSTTPINTSQPSYQQYLPTGSAQSATDIASGISGVQSTLDPTLTNTLSALGLSEANTGAQLTGAATGGPLPAAYQGDINAEIGAGLAANNTAFGALGLGDSTMAASGNAGVYGTAATTAAGIDTQLLQAGTAEQNAANTAAGSAGALNAAQAQTGLQAETQQTGLLQDMSQLGSGLYGTEASQTVSQNQTAGTPDSTAVGFGSHLGGKTTVSSLDSILSPDGTDAIGMPN